MKQYRYNTPELQARREKVYNEALEKAKKLVATMSLADKVGQLTMYAPGQSDVATNRDIDDNGSNESKLHHVGSYLGCVWCDSTNEIQKQVVNDNNQNVPALFGLDIIHGAVTTMPIPLAQSCTWDPDIARKCEEVAAKEAYSAGLRWTFAPMVDIARDPRWGRIAEGFGEDPYLASDFSASSVVGLQGEVLGEEKEGHILACLKHYVAYGAAEGGRDYNTVDISKQTLHDVYLPSFKAGVDAGSATLMSAFNTINGIPASGNKYTLWDVLREQWGFKGFVVSDYTSVHEMINHSVCENEKDAAEMGFNAGVDMVMLGNLYNANLPKLVEEGKVSEEMITRSAEIIVACKYLVGLMDEPYTDKAKEGPLFFSPEHRAVAREAAKNAVVLLENKNNILPLTKEKAKGKKIAVIGPNIENRENLIGCWAGLPDREKCVTIKQAIEEYYGDVAAEIGFVQGSQFYGCNQNAAPEYSDIPGAVELCKNADIVIACIGEYMWDTGECSSKSVINIDEEQMEMMRQVRALGKPIITLFSSGRPMVLTELKELTDGLLVIWNGGCEGGHGAVDAMSGEHNPSGRLTTSWPQTSGAIPNYYCNLPTGRPYGIYDGPQSHYFDAPYYPLYRFGYGLSYTTFEHSDLKLSSNEMGTDGMITVSCKVKNTGEVAGADVVQLYIRDVVACRSRPVKELKGYVKINLEPGEEKTITIDLPASELAFADEDCNMVVEPGKFKLWIAHSSEDESLGTEFFVK